MSEYSNNLHNEIASLLQSQELELKKIKSLYLASEFALYYAQGAMVTADEKLQMHNDLLSKKAAIKDQILKINGLSANVLTSASQENDNVNQAKANIASCAANVQTAANAITKLTSDVVAISNLIHAADFNSEIYETSKKAYKKMIAIATNAQKCSQDAMDATILISEVNSATVSDSAKLTNTAVQKLLKGISKECEDLSQEVMADREVIATSTIKATFSDGLFKNSKAAYLATQKAYETLNTVLNLGLNVAMHSDNSHTVSFNTLNAPFDGKNDVTAYYIMLVKEKNKSVFNNEEAEHIITLGEKSKRYTAIQIKSEKGSIKDTFSNLISTTDLLDTDGESLVLGENYVVFVMAAYSLAYKKELNDFEDYLSAPSHSFKLTYTLTAPDYKTFTIKDGVFYFEINGPHENNTIGAAKYRCMFLADTNNDIQFDLKLAEHIPKGNYTIAELIPNQISSNKVLKYRINLNLDTTDNFGNPLLKGEKYKPVVLAVATVDEVDQAQFTNALSDSTKTSAFTFNQIANQ
mgnify:CR=1 FL=1